MVRSQDRGIPSQVFKIVHDDCHEQVEHLHEKANDKKESGGRGSREGEREGRVNCGKMTLGAGSGVDEGEL